MSKSIPWTERMSVTRAPLDILLGAYPGFIFGMPVNENILPVFHFHEVTPAYLEPYFRYLANNGYRCADTAELLRVVVDGEQPAPGTVLLTFDDAWTSLWTVAAPLLRKYNLRGVTFAAPGRISGRDGLRQTIEGEPDLTDFGDEGEEPFCRWEELLRLEKEGLVEVESHTYSHEQIPVGQNERNPVWTEKSLQEVPLLSKPLCWQDDRIFRRVDESDIGTVRPITRSRMSDARQWIENENRFESDDERRAAIRKDLSMGYEVLEERLGRKPRILCFPWAVAGEVAREEARLLGYEAAFSDSFPGKRFVHSRSDPFRLMRLKHQWIEYLPGEGRRRFPFNR